MKKTIIFIALQLAFYSCLIAQNVEQEATRIGVKSPYSIFIGGIMKANDINSETHDFLDVQINPITFSSSLSAISATEITPSYSNMMNAIQKSLQDYPVIKPNYQFSFSIRQLDSFDQLSIFFGETIDLSEYFGITSLKLSHKNALVLEIKQGYFSVDMDLPNDLSDDPLVQNLIDELIYVNSIEFGRRAIAVIESNFSYGDLKGAMTEMVNNASDSQNAISEKSKAVIANSLIRTLILDPNETSTIAPDNPLEHIVKYMNAEVTPENFGIPIYFTAAWLNNNSLYVNKYP